MDLLRQNILWRIDEAQERWPDLPIRRVYLSNQWWIEACDEGDRDRCISHDQARSEWVGGS